MYGLFFPPRMKGLNKSSTNTNLPSHLEREKDTMWIILSITFTTTKESLMSHSRSYN